MLISLKAIAQTGPLRGVSHHQYGPKNVMLKRQITVGEERIDFGSNKSQRKSLKDNSTWENETTATKTTTTATTTITTAGT